MFQVLLSDEYTPIKCFLSSRSLSFHERVMVRDKLPHDMLRTAVEM